MRTQRALLLTLVIIAIGGAMVWAQMTLPGRPARPLARAEAHKPVGTCSKCHQKVAPGIFADHIESLHGQRGLDCSICHGTEHSSADDVAKAEMPTAADCGKCHAAQKAQFEASMHSHGWEKAAAGARWKAQYPAMVAQGCGGCHSVGKVGADGSRGRCDSCHTRHRFSTAEARRPEACGTCHMGPDHPQWEAYLSSKHGVVYTAEGDTGRAPLCVTCHMPGATHNVSDNLTIGSASQGGFVGRVDSGIRNVATNAIPMREITQEKAEINRTKMVAICTQCHSARHARAALDNADEIKRQTDAITGQAAAIVRGLYQDRLLDPMPEQRPANPVTGQKLTLGGDQLYEDTSAIEAMFFDLYKYHNINCWKGGYHFAPDYIHWYGNAPLKQAVDKIRGEAALLRKTGQPAEVQVQGLAYTPQGAGAEYPPAVKKWYGDVAVPPVTGK